MRTIRTMLMGAAASLLLAGGLLAQKPKGKPHPRIKEAAARATALARVPGARVQSHELEFEGGRWIYSYDLKTKGKSGIDEVNVDANNGEIVGGVEHEGPKAEAKEKAKEKGVDAKEPGKYHKADH